MRGYWWCILVKSRHQWGVIGDTRNPCHRCDSHRWRKFSDANFFRHQLDFFRVTNYEFWRSDIHIVRLWTVFGLSIRTGNHFFSRDRAWARFSLRKKQLQTNFCGQIEVNQHKSRKDEQQRNTEETYTQARKTPWEHRTATPEPANLAKPTQLNLLKETAPPKERRSAILTRWQSIHPTNQQRPTTMAKHPPEGTPANDGGGKASA